MSQNKNIYSNNQTAILKSCLGGHFIAKCCLQPLHETWILGNFPRKWFLFRALCSDMKWVRFWYQSSNRPTVQKFSLWSNRAARQTILGHYTWSLDLSGFCLALTFTLKHSFGLCVLPVQCASGEVVPNNVQIYTKRLQSEQQQDVESLQEHYRRNMMDHKW